MGRLIPHQLALLQVLAGLRGPPAGSSPSGHTAAAGRTARLPQALLGPHLLLALVLHALDLVPVRVLLQVALATPAGAEAERQVIALLGPHVLPALLLVPTAGAADAVELCQDAALPLVEALQVHPVTIRTGLAVAHHSLVVVLFQVNGPPQTANQRCRTWDFCEGDKNTEITEFHLKA